MDNQTVPGAPQPPVTPNPEVGAGSNGSETKEKVLGYVSQFEAWLDGVMVTKAPFQIPMGGKEFLATIAPYLVIVGVVLFVISLPVLLGFGAMTAGMGMMMGSGFGYMALVSLITGVVAVGLEAWAVPGLFKRSAHAWRLVFYATLVSFAGNVLAFNIVGAVIGGIIGWYLLFQIKALYKN